MCDRVQLFVAEGRMHRKEVLATEQNGPTRPGLTLSKRFTVARGKTSSVVFCHRGGFVHDTLSCHDASGLGWGPVAVQNGPITWKPDP